MARVRWLNLRSISTHAPAGGATRACVIIFVPVAFLLTPLREGRLHDPGADQDVRPISTHAPAGGATRCNRDDRGHGHISTHAPAGGATSGAGANGIARSHFYSRPCGRGDAHGRTYGSFRQISTHAPAGGATRVCHHRCRQNDNFYSRPCGRGDNEINIGQRHGSQFLLTPLREGRQVLKRLVRIGTVFLLTPLREGRLLRIFKKQKIKLYFYSRPCGRGDPRLAHRTQPPGRISTHAPAGGATGYNSHQRL